MASAHTLLNWLDGVESGDLKNIINGVDDHSDERLIQEDTVSSLIEVKQFLTPLKSREKRLGIHGFLKRLCELTKKNKLLVERIALCNGNCSALINLYNNINNRGEITKERIKNAATRGLYAFKRDENEENCIVEISYESDNGRG